MPSMCDSITLRLCDSDTWMNHALSGSAHNTKCQLEFGWVKASTQINFVRVHIFPAEKLDTRQVLAEPSLPVGVLPWGGALSRSRLRM